MLLIKLKFVNIFIKTWYAYKGISILSSASKSEYSSKYSGINSIVSYLYWQQSILASFNY